ncbi:MAG: nicotinate-nucleotide adenylyltransferase [Pseudomonadota bacterium]
MIGILGGTFDPIHLGHLRSAVEVRDRLGLQEVRFVPLNEAVHREQPLASTAHRCELVKRAIANQRGLVLDDREIRRGGASYMVDTLTSLREDLGPEVPLCLLMGVDAFEGMPDWREPLRVFDLAHVVIMQRPGSGRTWGSPLNQWVAERIAHDPMALRYRPQGRILRVLVTQMEIASTLVRKLFRDGGDPHFLLPDTVIERIQELGLYGCQPRDDVF